MISATTRAEIKGFLEGFVHGMVIEHKTPTRKASDIRPTKSYSAKGDIKPFHEALLPEGILRINEFERSFSTKLGTTFEECARLIGKERYAQAGRGHRTEGKVSQDAIRIIEASVSRIGTKGMARPYPGIVKEVLNARGPKKVRRTQISDLYLQDASGNEMFFEMKSPQPNKGQCLEVAERFLTIHAIRQAGPPRVRTYYAMTYNPYGADKAAYKWSFATRYMDIKKEVLIGKEFWDFIGGTGTYEELLEIYREVGREKGPDILDQLALDY
jgi:hypothetical protein